MPFQKKNEIQTICKQRIIPWLMRTITACTTATTITTTTKCKCENKFKPFPTLSLAVSEEIKLEISACIQMKALVASFLMVHDIWLFDKRKMVKIAIRKYVFFFGKNQQWPIEALLSLPPPRPLISWTIWNLSKPPYYAKIWEKSHCS